MRTNQSLSVVLVMIGVFAGCTHANHLTNGGFEQPTVPGGLPEFVTISAGSTSLVGWSVFNGSVDVTSTTFFPSFQGNQSLDLDGSAPGTITQTVTTLVGSTYSLTFAYANNPGPSDPPFTQSLPAKALISVFDTNGAILLSRNISHGTSAVANMNYSSFSDTFTADKTSTRLQFASTDLPTSDAGIVLDAVSIDVVPEPTALSVLATNTIAGLVNRRRQACRK